MEARPVPRGERKYYASRMVLHVDRELMLPMDTSFYDDKGDLFERYVYTDVRLNAGFTLKDFSRDNLAYGFEPAKKAKQALAFLRVLLKIGTGPTKRATGFLESSNVSA